jgi:hypothetical protein
MGWGQLNATASLWRVKGVPSSAAIQRREHPRPVRARTEVNIS